MRVRMYERVRAGVRLCDGGVCFGVDVGKRVSAPGTQSPADR